MIYNNWLHCQYHLLIHFLTDSPWLHGSALSITTIAKQHRPCICSNQLHVVWSNVWAYWRHLLFLLWSVLGSLFKKVIITHFKQKETLHLRLSYLAKRLRPPVKEQVLVGKISGSLSPLHLMIHGKTHSVQALIDLGVEQCFIDNSLAQKWNISKLSLVPSRSQFEMVNTCPMSLLEPNPNPIPF